MKKTLLFATTLGLLTLAVGATAHAGDQDNYPTIPDACSFDGEGGTGPARATHSPSLGEEQLPPCSELDLCVVFGLPPEPTPTPTPTGTPDGPSRAPHVAIPDGCEGIDEACWIVLQPAGPSRTTHQARPSLPRALTILISQDCQKALFDSIAPEPTPIPDTGSNSGPITLIAAALLLVGGGLLIAQRRTANR